MQTGKLVQQNAHKIPKPVSTNALHSKLKGTLQKMVLLTKQLLAV